MLRNFSSQTVCLAHYVCITYYKSAVLLCFSFKVRVCKGLQDWICGYDFSSDILGWCPVIIKSNKDDILKTLSAVCSYN